MLVLISFVLILCLNCKYVCSDMVLNTEVAICFSAVNDCIVSTMCTSSLLKGDEQEKSRDRNYKRTRGFQGRIAGNKVMF